MNYSKAVSLLIALCSTFYGLHAQNPVSPDKAHTVVRAIRLERWLSAAERSALDTAGYHVLGFFPPDRYLVTLPAPGNLPPEFPFAVRDIAPLIPQQKMSRALQEPPFPEWARHGRQIDVVVQVYPWVSRAFLIENLGKYTVLDLGAGFICLRVLPEALPELAGLEFVRFMDLLLPETAEDDIGRALVRTTLLDGDAPASPNLDGAGVRLLLRDDGPVGPHADFKGRLTNISTLSGSANGQHGDGVGGIWTGAGNIDPRNRGIVPGAEIWVSDYESTFLDTTLPLCRQRQISITNNSYGEGCNAGYTISAQQVDAQMTENPSLLHLFSAGNSNGANCGYGAGTQWGNITGGQKMAKNCLAVGNATVFGTAASNSSRGPATDGRIKPDLMAYGGAQVSTGADNTYQPFSGTSASAPAVAGIAAQLTQAFRGQYGVSPPAALLKAALLNTATDLGNPGPDFIFGWGMAHAQHAWKLLHEGRWWRDSLEQGDMRSIQVTVPANTKAARFMLYWPDFPAEAGAPVALVNDLDMEVLGPTGTLYRPGVLNPTPVPSLLSLPASPGRDSLNNAEQVWITSPDPGNYTLRVQGYSVPMGPQSFYLVWETTDDAVQWVYPAGGEAFSPGEIRKIFWDAYGNTSGFVLKYTLDGQSWQWIDSVSANMRSYDWTVPGTVSGQLRLSITRAGQSDTTAYPLAIAPVPLNVQVTRVCPDSMLVSWTPVIDTLSYDVYLLGEKYMEIVGHTAVDSFWLPISNPAGKQWTAVRARGAGTLIGRRSLGVLWPGGLKNCRQPYDLALRQILTPADSLIVSCAAVTREVKVLVVNEGLNPVSGALIGYSLNEGATVWQSLPDVAPDSLLYFSFQNPIEITGNGRLSLRVFTAFGADQVLFNDTVYFEIPVVVSPLNPPLLESFETPSFPPLGWVIENPDGAITWELQPQTVVGADNLNGHAAFLNCYNYTSVGQEDYLYLPPIRVPDSGAVALVFDVAHARYSDNESEALRVEAFPDCDKAQAPVLLWQESDPELVTAAPTTMAFIPDEYADWRQEFVFLDGMAGQTLLLRFASVNAYGNNIFIDRIRLVLAPAAGFSLSTDTVCTQNVVSFEIAQNVPGTAYFWDFGATAMPHTAQGPGPHAVAFTEPGAALVRLIAQNPLGADTLERTLTVWPPPVPVFNTLVAGQGIQFENNSQYATGYWWDFGDGATSSASAPVHLFTAPGLYWVQLYAYNICDTVLAGQWVGVSGAAENGAFQGVMVVYPNPGDGNFVLDVATEQSMSADVRLTDVHGRILERREIRCTAGRHTERFEHPDLPPGMYYVVLRTASGYAVAPLMVAP